MKTKLLFLFLFVALSTKAQRPSIMQPSLKDSGLQLDSIYAERHFIIRRNEYPNTERWYAKAYDSDNNPTEFIIKFNNVPNLDSIKVVFTHADLNKSVNTHLHNTGYHNYLSPEPYFDTGFSMSSHVLDIFNLSSVLYEQYNQTTQQWQPVYEKKFLPDLRMPEAYDLGYTTYTYDANNNMITHNYIESVLDNYGYPSEKNIYDYSGQLSRKSIYYNTYNVNGKLIESIRNDIIDFNSNTEVPYYKYTFNYGTNTFEKIKYIIDQNTNQWVEYSREFTTYDSYGAPSTEDYVWVNNQWEIINSTDNSAYNNGLYLGYYHPAVSETSPYETILNLDYNNCGVITSRNFETIADYGGNMDGEAEYINLFFSETASSCVVNSIDDDLLNKVTIHPNPAKDKIYINSTENFDYTIYSSQGKLLSKGKLNSQLDISNLQDGVYILNLTNSTISVNRKIILKR